MTTSSYGHGYDVATDYGACNASEYGYEEEDAADFYEGYGDGMLVNLQLDGGVCPDHLRSEPEDLESWGW